MKAGQKHKKGTKLKKQLGCNKNYAGGESLYIKLSLPSSERDNKKDSQSTNQLPELTNEIPETKTQMKAWMENLT